MVSLYLKFTESLFFLTGLYYSFIIMSLVLFTSSDFWVPTTSIWAWLLLDSSTLMLFNYCVGLTFKTLNDVDLKVKSAILVQQFISKNNIG